MPDITPDPMRFGLDADVDEINISVTPDPMRFGLGATYGLLTAPVTITASPMRFGLDADSGDITASITPDPMRFGLDADEGGVTISLTPDPMRFGLDVDTVGIWYPKLKVDSPVAYLLEVHAKGDATHSLPISVLNNAIRPQWTENLNGIDVLTFEYEGDDAKLADIDLDHEVWIRRYETGEIKQRFLLWKKIPRRDRTVKITEFTMMGLASQLIKTPISTTALGSNSPLTLLASILGQQTQAVKVSLGSVDTTIMGAESRLGTETTAWKALKRLSDIHGGYIGVDRNWKLYWISDPHLGDYPKLQYRKNLLTLSREDDYSLSDTPTYTYKISVASRAETEAAGLGPEVLYAGQVVNIYDEDLGIDVDLRIVKLTHHDLTQPYLLDVEIGSKTRTLTEMLESQRDHVSRVESNILNAIGYGGEYVPTSWESSPWVASDWNFDEWDPTGGADYGWYLGTDILVNSNVAVGNVVYDTGNGWDIASCDTEEKAAGDLLVVTLAAAAGQKAKGIEGGLLDYDMSGVGATTARLYLGTAGAMTVTPPLPSEFVRVVGRITGTHVRVGIDASWGELVP